MKFKEYTLDTFQEQAVNALLEDSSVVVSAATGTGKTLIADYMIDHSIKNKKKVFYTAPIKALSNQKYNDFKEAYGEENVGLLTGDTVINGEAQIVVMTTEVYRNMLVEGSETLNNLKYVVFDEIHFINDIERGTVWEESIIFSPDQVRFICLSATIPNYDQFAAWIESIAQHKVVTVSNPNRAVPLEHLAFDTKLGITQIDKLAKVSKKDAQYTDYYSTVKRRRNHRGQRGQSKDKKKKWRAPNHIDLVKDLKDKGWLPAIYFVFSRRATYAKAQELARKQDFTTPETKQEILKYLREHITEDIADMPSIQILRSVLSKGIGIHNAGVLPQGKKLVEQLFNKGLLQVLYATETFAVGINMPAKAVCFDSMEKYDGFNFRYLNTKEYFQLAGRAGRRGIDPVGRSIVAVNRATADFDKLQKTTDKDIEPIISQFKLSYNTVLNLVKNYGKDEQTIEVILKSNFGYFVKKQSKQQARITTSYNNYKRILERLGYIKNDQLEEKGTFATHIFTNELATTELFFSDIAEQLSNAELIVVLASMMYERRRSDEFYNKRVKIDRIINIVSQNKYVAKKVKKIELKMLFVMVSEWANGATFEDIIDLCNLPEGDIIRMFRQIIDMLRQIRAGLINTKQKRHLVERIDQCMESIDRDLVSTNM